ncbi:unnamed protein product [Euphydryas editha]|uniref:BED-type domain-containing protein n=1 Tax=Euphydryas editha TaxID=104508 RepID=A0AAU9VDL0_EUPED|nr:unnamed protein product [Euphydryas editha]
MGRLRNKIIWRHYQELEDKSVKCTFCDKHYKKGHVTKMTQHLMTCFKCPQAVKKEISDQTQPNESRESTSAPIVTEDTSSDNIDLREEFSKALLITGMPLSMVEHPLWIKLFEKFNFKLPGRKMIANKYLEKIYKEMYKKINEDITSSSFLHLQCDGWTDICNEGIINFVISKPDPLFINSLNTHDNRRTSEYLSCEIEKVTLEDIKPTADIKYTLLDEDFWCMLDQCVSILEPVADSIFKLEGNKFNIHEVFMVLRNLKSKLEFVLPSITMLDNENKENIKTCIEKRVKQCLKPIHYAAYMLDPKSVGIELDHMQETEAMEFICSLAEHLNIDCLVDLAQYKGKEGLWGKAFTWKAAEKVSPTLWWKGICGSSQLSKIALRVLTAPCTSAATERTFSTQGFIHSAKRNRLTSERAAKITFISHNWNLINNNERETEMKDEDSDENFIVQDDDMIRHNYMESVQDLESSLLEKSEDNEPIASTSRGITDFQFVCFTEGMYDSDTDY